MGGITSGVGLFSGIDTRTLINQLLAVESRPKILAQRRVAQLQGQQAAYLDINSRLNSLKSAAAAFRTSSIFDAKKASSSDDDVLTATASKSAAEGTYSFIVDRLVSTQQLLSKGFADSAGTSLGADSFTFESAQGRLDRETSLSELNGGAGIERGKIVITDSTTGSVTIDLSKAATVNDVLDAINNASGLNVTASVQGGRFVVDHDGAGTLTIRNDGSADTAGTLGITAATAVATVTGSSVHALNSNTSLNTLNDGNGVMINKTVGVGALDFTITVDTTAVSVNLGDVWELVSGELEITEAAVGTVGGAIERINEALEDALGDTSVVASISGNSIRIVDSNSRSITVADRSNGTTASDLGIEGTAAGGTLTGSEVLAGINSTLGRLLNGGSGIAGTGSISITGRDGNPYTVTIDTDGSLEGILREFSSDTGGLITARMNDAGTGIVVTDATGGTGNLVISGTTAESLGIDTAGVASSTVESGSLQHAYITGATQLSKLNGGQGVGTGKFRVTDSTGRVETYDIGSDTVTVQDLISEINGRTQSRARARVNAQGDGIEIYEEIPGGGSAGSVKIKVEDSTGVVAKSLRIAGEAAGTGASNVIDGSYETEVEFELTDTLEDVARKINNAGAGVSATIVNDGSSGTPFRLSLSSKQSGSNGRVSIDTGGFDLGLSTLDAGRNAIAFFGSSDPASAVLLTSSSNTLDDVVAGVSIDLAGTSDDPIEVSVVRDTSAIEGAIQTFVDAFNDTVERIQFNSRYDSEAQVRGPLLGDGTVQQLRSALFSTIQGDGTGLTGAYTSLFAVGFSLGDAGVLEFDREEFRTALADDPEAVEDLFAARVIDQSGGSVDLGNGIVVTDPEADTTYSTLGVVSEIEELAKGYLDSVDGVLVDRREAIQSQIELQTARIAAFDTRLEARRAVLERQFLSMEQAIARLSTQQSSLAQLASIR